MASADVLVVGAGLAGLATALGCARRGLTVTVLSPAPDAAGGQGTASALAQGGLAAAVGCGDSPALHCADTVAAGAGLTHPEIAERITSAAPGVVTDLLDLGARFDRDAGGALRLGLEGAHGRHRIVHARGDGSGAEIMRAVAAATLSHPRVTVWTRTRATRVRLDPTGTAVGIDAIGPAGALTIEAGAVVLATGGIGGLFAHTTNPLTSWGSGLALGLRAGARVRDLELVQFHPSALDVGIDPMPLVSEAVRGAGAPLVRDDGTLLADPLGARDVVARAVWDASRAGHRVYLDLTGGSAELRATFATRFPTVNASCLAAGIDPTRQPIPVRPAAHYHMGGLVVDLDGRTDVPGLWAVGEVASTGLHGANRLASNSLLEALVCAGRVADALALPHDHDHVDRITVPPMPDRPAPTPPTAHDRLLLENAAGLYRDGAGLRHAAERMRVRAEDDDARLVATLLLRAALQRTESRGAHRRLDHPAVTVPRHTYVDLTDLDQPLTERSAS